jgi:hypothetical protein
MPTTLPTYLSVTAAGYPRREPPQPSKRSAHPHALATRMTLGLDVDAVNGGEPAHDEVVL